MKNDRILSSIRLVAVVAAATLAPASFGTSFSLDLRAAPTRGTVSPHRSTATALSKPVEQPPRQDGTLRSFRLDPGAADVGAIAVGDDLALTLFDNVALTLVLSDEMESSFGDDIFLARTDGAGEPRNAVVLRTEEGLTIDVQDCHEGKIYQVVSSSDGVTVREIEPEGESLCGNDALDQRAAPFAMEEDLSDASGPPLASAGIRSVADADVCVDILVAYDRNAAAWATANGGGLTNFAQVAVQKMNAALANTGLSSSFRFRLVGVTSLPVSETDVHEALYAINREDAGWKEIKAVREKVGADIVTTLVDTGSAYGTTGVGWSLSSGTSPSSFGGSAYNVCAVRSVAQSHTMTHECGHNMGAGHATAQKTQPGPQLFPYSAGHYFTGTNGKKYCTIMAYASEGPGGTEVPYFSSPDHSYAGVATGDATHDNTRTLENTWSYAANWRAQATPISYNVEFSPASGTLIDGVLDVVLTPGKAGTPIRYTLDGSAPTASSPLYDSPIRLTRTTTIRASTVVGGVCSLPFSAIYFSQSDLGYAMGLPEYDWTISAPASSRCGVQTTNTVDDAGVGADVADGDVCSISAMVEGPATISWKSMGNGNVRFRVVCDGSEVFSDSWSGYSLSWFEQTADIPEGTHRIEFRLESRYGTTHYWLDDFRFFKVKKPIFRPATGTTSSTATTFSGELMISLASERDDALLFYTLDGSDPTGEQALLYDGPFPVSESVKVRAVAIVPGLGSSAIAEGWFVKGDPPKAGEWTLDGNAAFQAVRSDGRMIAELYWNYPGCLWSKALESIIVDPAFTSWAALNGVYLLADSWGDKPAPGGGKFSPLYRQTDLYEAMDHRTYFPTFVFASAADTDTCLGALLARNDENVPTANGIRYRDSVESLVAGFASFLGSGKPLGPPVPSVANASGRTFPFSITLSNTNGTGTIYYTLDGSEPTRTNGIRYTGAISIPRSGTLLKAAVWPSGAGAVSGVPLVVTYESLSEAIGISSLSWTNDPTHPWTVRKTSSGVVLSGYKDLTLASGSVSSALKVSLNGPGMLSYRYDWEPWDSRLVLKQDGVVRSTLQYRQISGETNLVLSAGGATELSWVYEYSYKDNLYPYLSCDISDIVWTPFAPPSTPVADLTASQGTYNDGTLLRWTDVENAEKYIAYRGTTANSATATRLGATDKNRYWDFTGEMGKTYYYWVSSSNAWGESALSGPVTGWRPSGWTVSFDANGGNGSMPKLTVARGKTATLPANEFSRTGWSFDGWATSAGGSASYADGADIAPAADMTLYAKWTANTYAITLDRQNGTGGSTSITATFASEMPAIAVPTLTGYMFGGYFTAANGGGTQYYKTDGSSARTWNMTSATTLYAKWTGKTYPVTLDRQNGSGGTASTTATYGSVMPAITTPTRTGYTFGGYFTAKNGGGTQYYTATGASVRTWNKTAATTLYAKWTGNPYVVTFDRQSGTGGSASATATYGSAMPAIATPTRTGYTFGGYFTAKNGGGTQYYTATGASARTWNKTAATTLYAKWTGNPYVVTLAPQGGSGGTASTTATYAKSMPAITVPTRTGYTFGGYYTSANGAGIQYYTATGSSARTWNKASAATLYAKWTANAYAVTLDPQGGTGGTASAKATYGSEMPGIAVPRREEFIFGGYFSAPGGGGTQYYTADGMSARAWNMPSATTLYAMWTPEPKYIELAVNRLRSPATGEYLYSGDEVEMAAMVRAGWAREGVVFRALAEPYYGAVPLYRFMNRITGFHLFTIDENEKAYLQTAPDIWTFEGPACYVEAGPDGELSPPEAIYRARYNVTGQYILSSDALERSILDASPLWSVEGIAFWAASPIAAAALVENPAPKTTFFEAADEPVPSATEKTSARRTCLASSVEEPEPTATERVPVYRLRRASGDDRLFTASEEERAVLAASGSWAYEGVAFYACACPEPGTVPLHRLSSSSTGECLLTADETERDMLVASDDWNLDGVVCFVAVEPGEETVAANRLRSPETGFLILTTSEEEKTALVFDGWTDEGVAFHVWP